MKGPTAVTLLLEHKNNDTMSEVSNPGDAGKKAMLTTPPPLMLHLTG